jgi:hypothetical protein
MAEKLPWRVYRRRATGTVEAFRNDGPRSVLVRGNVGETVSVRKGEWAVRSAGREARALSPETFEALYVAAEEE